MECNSKALSDSPCPGRSVIIAGFVIDLVLVCLGIIFNFSFVFFVFPFNVILLGILAAVCVLRRHVTLRRLIVVRILFYFILVFTVDVILLMHAAIYGWNPVLLAVAPLSYAATVYLRSVDIEQRRLWAGLLKVRLLRSLLTAPRRLQWDAPQCLIVPLVLTFALSTKADAPANRGACASINTQPGTRLILDLRSVHGSKIRDMIFVDDPALVFLTYRKGLFSDFMKDATAIRTSSPNEQGHGTPALEAVDPATGKTTILAREGEAVGITRYPEDSGDIYAVVVNREPDSRKSVSQTDLLRVSPAGQLKLRMPLPVANSVSYAASMVPYKDNLIIIIEGEFYRYNPETNQIVTVSSGNTVAPFMVERQDRYIYGVNVHSPLFTLFTPNALVKFDLKSSRVVGSRYGGLFGYYDIRRVPGADRFLVSNMWIGGGVIVDTELRTAGTVALPRGTRKFLVDSTGRYAYVPNFFTGYLRIMDLHAKHPLPGSWFVGKGVRSIYPSNRGTILIGNSCGIVEADPQVLRSGK